MQVPRNSLFLHVKEPLYGAARPETNGSFTKRVMMINLEVGGLLEVVRLLVPALPLMPGRVCCSL